MTRYALIDKMLANRYSNLSIQDITDALSKQLTELGQSSVSKRCIEKDIKYLQSESPFLVNIEDYKIDEEDKNGRVYKKRCIRYTDPTFSIFKPKLSDDEKAVLKTALETLGNFDGLENFEWLSDLKHRLKMEEHETIISISKNISSNSTLLAKLYTIIRQKNVIRLFYHTFDNLKIRTVNITPHLLKEYNNRWYLIASACDTKRILTFPLDRIDDISVIYTEAYISAPTDLTERYEDIIGVTYIEDAPLLEIIIWASDESKNYIYTKPLHGSQTIIRNNREMLLRTKYPQLKGGTFLKIECKENYELIRELTSFGENLVVLSPSDIVQKVKYRITQMLNKYQALT